MLTETYAQQVNNSPYRNIYWFSRYLIDTDKYGAVGSKKTEAIMRIVLEVESILSSTLPDPNDSYAVAKRLLLDQIRSMARPQTKTGRCIEDFADTLDRDIQDVNDLASFCLAMRYIVAPINIALARIPANDRGYVMHSASSFLKEKGEAFAGDLIEWWDSLGIKGCLNAERIEVVTAFAGLAAALERSNSKSKVDDYIIMTAFVQEFERRLGQKRKQRGGGSLEDVVDFLFTSFDFPSAEKPTHFDQDLEVDKWFKCGDGWLIGISCKRTLRERWKQLSQADRGTLSHHKIKEVWHIITLDRDLSDDKIVRLGEQNHVFFLRDDSKIYQRCINHVGMKDYVRPLSQLIKNIRTNLKK